MGKVIDFQTGEDLNEGLSPEANELMEKVFAICTESPLEPSEIIWLMMTTFGNSIFYGLSRDDAVDLFSYIVTTLIKNNELTFTEIMRAMSDD